MNAEPTMTADVEHGDGDDGADALVEFIASLLARVQARGELIHKAVEQDILATVAELAGTPKGDSDA